MPVADAIERSIAPVTAFDQTEVGDELDAPGVEIRRSEP